MTDNPQKGLGISEIAQGDAPIEEHPPVIPPNIPIDELHPDDQDLVWWWELLEPALEPWSIDPIVRWQANQKRKKK
jgi:hypothetical protein